jgi:hypothetical protein
MHKWPSLLRVVLLGGVVIAVGSVVEQVRAVGLNYVDANDFTNLTPASAIDSFAGMTEPDNLWDVRTDFGLGLTVFQAINEDAPVLTQMITGFTPGASYDVYAVFQTDDDENWLMRTGLTPDTLTQYSFRGGSVGPATAMVNSTPGITAAAAVWDTLPPANKEGTVFTERPADTLVLLLGKAGTAMANGSGQIGVLIDDLANTNRTWLEGVAYVAAGTPISLVTSLDRATGAITITNPTSEPFQITSYTIDSPAGGLDATTWTQITGWDATAMPDTTAAFATQITQTDPTGTGRTIAANGGSLSFGNVWNASPTEDVVLRLTLANNEIAVILPEYTGSAITAGDFNASGTINLEDFQTLLTNLHTDVATLSVVEAYQRGDMNGDRAINFNDFRTFRTAYDTANGAGAFAQLVPEPDTCAMLLVVAAVCGAWVRRRSVASALVLVTCCVAVNQTNAATLLSVDVDARAGDSTAGPPGDNTLAGFMPFTIMPGTTGAQATTTGMVGGYTVTLTAVDATGAPVGMFDDRDRATPTTAPTFGQLYDDFIFANVATTGEGGGLDMLINGGGALMPNTEYDVSIFSFDTGSTGLRTADWLDGNAADAIVFQTMFDGAVANHPTTDEQYKFGGTFRTDGSGNLLLRARETSAASHGVFINGFTISDDEPDPEPIELTLEVNAATGAVRIANEQTVGFDMGYYEIRSSSGSLNPAGWTSFDDGEGGDAVGMGWDEAAASNANILSEVNLTSLRTFDPGSSVSLGLAFTAGAMQDVNFFYAAPTATVLRTGIIKFVTGPSGITGDYNGNNVVDAADYVVWRNALATPTSTLPNDATPGTVDQSDYTVWRSNFGRTSGSAAGLTSGAAVPEPSTFGVAASVLFLLNLATGFSPRRRASRIGAHNK